MYEGIFRLLVSAVQLVVPPLVGAAVLLFGGLEIAESLGQRPQVVVVPETPASEPCPVPTPAPAVAPMPPREAPTVIVIETSGVTQWLGVVDIRRSELNRILMSQPVLGSTRILPHMANGQCDGFRIYGVRSDSLLFAMGLRSGDMIHEINGRELSTPGSVLELYASLPPYLDVTLTRQRRPARLLVLIHDDPTGPEDEETTVM